MNDIYNAKLLDLLPPNLRSDPDIIAASQGADIEFKPLVSSIKNVLTFADIDNACSEVVDNLAWELHADFYDTSLLLETRRELAKNALIQHMLKGTPAAVENAIVTVFGRSWLEEWYEYGGNPYYFRVNVEATKQGASEADLAMLDRLIEAYKNKRSWLEKVNVFLTTHGSMYYAGCTNAGEQTTIYPWSITEVECHGLMRFAAGHQIVETTTIYPAT